MIKNQILSAVGLKNWEDLLIKFEINLFDKDIHKIP